MEKAIISEKDLTYAPLMAAKLDLNIIDELY